MRKLLSFFITVFTLVMILAIPSYAAEEAPIEVENHLFKTFKVATDSEIKLDSLEAYEENGKKKVRVGNTRSANGQKETYDVEVDFQTGTYKVTNYSIDTSVEAAKDSVSINAINNYLAIVTAKTLDPINILCNSTTLQWGWSENTSTTGYPYGFNTRSLSWWDAQPTSLGTYWYYVSHSWHDPSGSGQSAFVTHVNYNFGGGLFGDTYASHYISILPEPNGRYHYYVELETEGVAGNLLHLSVETN